MFSQVLFSGHRSILDRNDKLSEYLTQEKIDLENLGQKVTISRSGDYVTYTAWFSDDYVENQAGE